MTAARAHRRQGRRRAAAIAALLLGPLAIASAAEFVGENPWQAFSMLLSLALALAAGWFGLVRRGITRIVALAIAAFLAAGVVETLVDTRVVDRMIIVGMAWGSIAAAGAAFAIHVPLSPAAPPRRPVLFINPRSGGGKAARHRLDAKARARGIEPVELAPGDDLEALAEAAVEPARTRSRWPAATARRRWSPRSPRARPAVRLHPVGDAQPLRARPRGRPRRRRGRPRRFVDGGERVVDLAEVNGRVFVNNVSLGLYAAALQREGYRAAKLRTVLRTLPDVAGPGSAARDLGGATRTARRRRAA